ncbi:MAG: sulfite exporter TauE/SafE family protein [Saprospiraceae bacterium]
MEPTTFMVILIFLVALLYSSVGHGGASGYIAVMALFGLAPTEIRTNALLLNIAVAGIAYLQFMKKEALDKRLVIPLFFASIPMAYLGGSINLNDQIFKYILAAVLFFPVIRFSGFWNSHSIDSEEPITWVLILAGGTIGLISGLIGIGGGIILTPLLLWFGWSSVKQAALISSLFIVVNSIAGFVGLLKNPVSIPENFIILLIFAVAGGIIGSFSGAFKFSNGLMKKVLACVLFIAIIKLITI